MRSYEITAEYYDVLQATRYVQRADAVLSRWLGRPRVGALDVGAGTGLATELLAQRCDVTVHAVEPTRSMRTVLLSRLAGRPELLEHVRVHARPIQDLGLSQVADFGLCLNTMGTLDRAERAEALTALAEALTSDATLVLQRPPDTPGRAHADLPAWHLGGDVYSGDVTCIESRPGAIEWRFTYRVTRDDAVIREEVETFDGFLVAADDFDIELANAGFVVTDVDDHDVVVARRAG
ncbi:MAG TPA: methyltransferase domain-containing protein [Micromonosporaceae bacterium]|nr:methyltransferase domain-containing protein [Micromonosporaceae bacterium]